MQDQFSGLTNGAFHKAERELPLAQLIGSEERRFSLINSSLGLRSFSRRIEHWELLLRILQNRESTTLGLNDIPSLCRFGGMHHNSLARFLREQIAAKWLYTEVGDRRDKKTVRPSAALVVEFTELASVRE